MNNREFFNSMAEKWDNTVNHNEEKIKDIVNMVELDEGNSVLDVGTGTGIMIPFLYSQVKNSGTIIAVDIAEKMIEVARRKFCLENVEFIAADVLEIELPDNFFDCIICYSMFPHFTNKRATIKKLTNHLKKSGKFVICHSESRDTINRLHRNVSEAVKDDRLPPVAQIIEYFSYASLKTISVVDNEEMYVIIGRKD